VAPLYREHHPRMVARLWRLNAGDPVAWAGLSLDGRSPVMAAASAASIGHPWRHDATSEDDLSRFSGSTRLVAGQPVENPNGTAGAAFRAGARGVLSHPSAPSGSSPAPAGPVADGFDATNVTTVWPGRSRWGLSGRIGFSHLCCGPGRWGGVGANASLSALAPGIG
jgi:hypothetical protein